MSISGLLRRVPMRVVIPSDEIEGRAWELIRAGEAPTMTALIEWADTEVNKRENAPPSPGQMAWTRSVRDASLEYYKPVQAVLWKLVEARVLIPGRCNPVPGHAVGWDGTQISPGARGVSEPLPADPKYMDRVRQYGIQ